MATRIWVNFVSFLTVFWAGVYAFFIGYFDEGRFEALKVQKLQSMLNHERRTLALMDLRMNEYRDSIVAAGVKIGPDTPWAEPKRVIASVIADPEYKKIPTLTPGLSIFREAKNLFVEEKYEEASEKFSSLIKDYPDSMYLPEAGFLLAEATFTRKKFDASISAVNFVITHFPETEYAGLSLCRLGKLFEKQERFEDAADVYHLVNSQYPNSQASSLATEALKGLRVW